VQHLESLANSSRPFLGVVHLNVNHYPYNTRPEYRRWTGSDLDLYDNTILETDTHTRRLFETLERTGQLDRTVILFASDHGEGFNEHGYIAHFYCHFVETVAVPLWLYLPERFAAGRDLSVLRGNQAATVQNLDLLPTLLDCIGAWDHPGVARFRAPMMGGSLFRPLAPDRTVWITNTNEVMPSVIGLSSITGRWHYMLRTSGTPPLEDLYDLESDPHERHNLWPQTSPQDRDRYRRSFLQFPVAARMMTAAFPHLAPADQSPPRQGEP
jgi:arylsulfatase A-like enzyme